MSKKAQRQRRGRNKRLKFAIYARISSEEQNEKSLEDQIAMCKAEVAKRGGTVVAVYEDNAESGWSINRAGFQQMRADAEKGKYGALMLWKFDRLGRHFEDTTAIKMLLRKRYGMGLFCVQGFSQDDEDDPMPQMMERILAIFSAFYSDNLSMDTKRAKYQKALKGEFNGSRPPFGYDLVTKKDIDEIKKNGGDDSEGLKPGLYINETEAEIVLQVFQMYATGNYSMTDIAVWMNSIPYVADKPLGKKPFGQDTVRDMLRNKTYTGRVSYVETHYTEALGVGKSYRVI